ncbi:MAG: multidrug effflux MFS transporter [Pseudomonadota bacterium]
MDKRLPVGEFVALTALMFSLIAYGTDAMLPALPLMAADLGSDVTRTQLVIGVFILGTGAGQLIAGPLSDAAGRKPVLLGGFALFALGGIWASQAGSLDAMLLARFVQGLGVSAPRTVGMAMVRDLYSGRVMARVISLAMMAFVIVPALAPFLGQWIMLRLGWQAIYLSCTVIGLFAASWLWLRQGETHAPERRRPMRAGPMLDAVGQVVRSRRAAISTLVLTLIYAMIFAYLSSAQQVFVDWLDTGARFPAYFAVIAMVSGTASALNAALVVRIGMWRLATVGMGLVALGSFAAALTTATGLATGIELWLFMGWSILLFFLAGIIFSNMNALAMEPMGHIAGSASAVIGATSTVGSVLIAVPIGQAYNGTGLPLILGVGTASALAFGANLLNPREVPLAPGAEASG